MLYRDVREQIQTGDVLLAQGRALSSRLIRLRTRGYYTHAGIFVWVEEPADSGNRRLRVVEAMEGVGIRSVHVSYYLNHDHSLVDWWQLDSATNGIDRHAVAEYALKFDTGQNNYAYGQLLRSFGLFLPWHRLLPERPNERFCSWLVAEALHAGGYRGDGDTRLAQVEPHKTTPDDVGRFTCLRRRGELIKGEAERCLA